MAIPGLAGVTNPRFHMFCAPTAKTAPRQPDSFWCRARVGQAVGRRRRSDLPTLPHPPGPTLAHHLDSICPTCRSEEASRLAGCQPAAPMVACRVVVVKLDVRTLFPSGVALCLSRPAAFAQKGYIRPIATCYRDSDRGLLGACVC